MTDYNNDQTDTGFEPPGAQVALYQTTANVPKGYLPEFLMLLEEEALEDQQKIELIQTYWNLSMYFVKMGFGVLPFQTFNQLAAPCGKALKSDDLSSASDDHMLQSEYQRSADHSEKGGPQ